MFSLFNIEINNKVYDKDFELVLKNQKSGEYKINIYSNIGMCRKVLLLTKYESLPYYNDLYNNPNSYRDVAQFHQIEETPVVQQPAFVPVQPVQQPIYNQQPMQQQYIPQAPQYSRIIGVKNVTKSAGATTLVYMMYKELSRNYRVSAIEVDKTDFAYFNDNKLISAISGSVQQEVANLTTSDVILIDVNGSVQAESLCNEIIYLIEPTTIKLNKLMMVTPQTIKKFLK